MAEALMRHRLSGSGLKVSIESRGLMPSGRPMPELAQGAMARRGIDVSEYRSIQLQPQDVADTRLLLGMERRHVREAVVLDPGALGRCFTIRDFVSRARSVGPRAGRKFTDWLAEVGEGRGPADLMGDGRPDELPDPMGGSPEFFEAVACELEGLIDNIIWLVLGGPRPKVPTVESVPSRMPMPPPPQGGMRRWLSGPNGPGRNPYR